MNRSIIIVLLITLASHLHGQPKVATDSIPAPYIERFGQSLILRLSQHSDIEKLIVVTEGPDIRLSPNVSSITSLSVGYRFLHFSYNRAAKFLPGNDDDDIRGKSKHTGYSFGLNFNHWNQELSYSRTKGYYIENTGEFDPSWSSDKPYFQFPAFRYTQFRGRTFYKFNNKFSIPSVLTQTERQLRSAGSLIAEIRYRYYITDDPTPPPPGRFTQRSSNIEILPGLGYDYTFVLSQRVYFSVGSTAHAGYLHSAIKTKFTDTEIHDTQHNPIFRWDGRLGGGYNATRFFAGFYLSGSATSYRQQGNHLKTQNNAAFVQLFAGYRLHAPPWLKNGVDRAGRAVGIK